VINQVLTTCYSKNFYVLHWQLHVLLLNLLDQPDGTVEFLFSEPGCMALPLAVPYSTVQATVTVRHSSERFTTVFRISRGSSEHLAIDQILFRTLSKASNLRQLQACIKNHLLHTSFWKFWDPQNGFISARTQACSKYQDEPLELWPGLRAGTLSNRT